MKCLRSHKSSGEELDSITLICLTRGPKSFPLYHTEHTYLRELPGLCNEAKINMNGGSGWQVGSSTDWRRKYILGKHQESERIRQGREMRMKVFRCQDDEFDHHLRQGKDMINVMYQIVRRRKRNSSSGIIIPSSVIHHINIDMTRARILILIFRATGKLIKQKKNIVFFIIRVF